MPGDRDCRFTKTFKGTAHGYRFQSNPVPVSLPGRGLPLRQLDVQKPGKHLIGPGFTQNEPGAELLHFRAATGRGTP